MAFVGCLFFFYYPFLSFRFLVSSASSSSSASLLSSYILLATRCQRALVLFSQLYRYSTWPARIVSSRSRSWLSIASPRFVHVLGFGFYVYPPAEL